MSPIAQPYKMYEIILEPGAGVSLHRHHPHLSSPTHRTHNLYDVGIQPADNTAWNIVTEMKKW